MRGTQTQGRLGFAAIILALAVTATADKAWAKSGQRSGEEVVEAECARCHGTGVDGAPKIGDRKAWSKLEAQGLSGLKQRAITGIRKMPAHGGNPGISNYEIERAITTMVNRSGGHWIQPTDKTAKIVDRPGKEIVRIQCSKCHQTGVGGAPGTGDRATWIPRGAHGIDALVRSAINGHGGMPARGGMADLTDGEIREAVIYMFNQGIAVVK